MQLRGAPDRNNPRLLGQQPRERDLSGGCLLPLRDLTEQVDQGLICLPGLRRAAGEGVAEVGTVEPRAFVDLSREVALPQRALSSPGGFPPARHKRLCRPKRRDDGAWWRAVHGREPLPCPVALSCQPAARAGSTNHAMLLG